MVLGKFPPEKFPPIKLPLEKFASGKYQPGIFPPILLIVFLHLLVSSFLEEKFWYLQNGLEFSHCNF